MVGIDRPRAGSFMSELYHPIFIFGAIVLAFVVTTMIVTHVFPKVRKNPVKMSPYESGVEPMGDARKPFDVRYYRIAIDFLIFDVEVLLIYPLAVVFGQRLLGEEAVGMDGGFIGIMVFMLLLVVGYIYSWRKGSFRWR
jgi:NADH-quinone oxidoreductase subunit A